MTRRRLLPVSLRSRLLLVVLVALLPGFGVAIDSALRQFERAEEDAYDQVRRAVRLSIRRNEQVVSRAHLLLRAVANGSRAFTVEEMCAQLALLPLTTGPTDGSADAGVVNEAAEVLCDVSGAGAAGRRLGEHGRIAVTKAATSGAFSIGEYDITPDAMGSAQIVVYPLSGRGDPVVLLFAWLSLDWFDTLASDLRLPADSALTIVDAKAVVVGRYPDPDRWVGETIAQGPLFRLIAGPESEGAGEAVGVDGVRRLYAFAPLEPTGSGAPYIAVGIPSAYAFGEARQTLFQSLAGLVALGAVALLASHAMAERSVLRKTRALTAAAEQMAAGDLSARVGDVADDIDELSGLARAFNGMAASVQRAQALGEQRYAELLQRDNALRAASHKLELQRERLDLLSRELLRTQEKERQHVARELHDEIGQSLTALKINLQVEKDTTRQSARIDDSIRIVNNILAGIRELSLMLRPPLLQEAGLRSAVNYLLASESQRSGIRMESRIAIGEARFPSEVELVVFRIVQEAVTNAIRHSKAHSLTVALEERDGVLELSIRDDGRGFDVERRTSAGAGFGLVSMQERAVLAGGTLRIESAPGAGTAIHARISVASGITDS